ncbi:hypothetical protein CGRA01v4_12185 [Colletotrichum graminicola]|uniref:Killer toxin Kp4 domain-containing protein n=1 Tax=Colletotrichum graminicola (strain M1.001 / M2 / FGSC 10212) TaxID=645133 RepID=E3QTD2_COLGM|nr:uncharacterized protein GLRG_09264 [Colletotrichum graminicola M1.001]EFQ34120.1 hypothetical protein GLRG_09264 [Colletotrichum graminicola M1.001]WDK20896.1 hypothetical protein CGRA01v4_12185 [Colletotrichum graminicola]
MRLDILAVAAAILSPAAALGINCRGSGNCNSDNFQGAASELAALIRSIPDGRWFNNGQQIACFSRWGVGGGICAFYQNTGGWQAKKAKDIVGHLVSHGCKVCGSVPTGFPGSNDVAQGQLTFNYVAKPCTGLWEERKVC